MQLFHSVLLLFLASRRSTALLSDFKTCGDPQCESFLSRVQATQNYKGPDCRFLSFQRGHVIFVYYKLSGKRDDLWAGSEQDFFCIDEYGAIIEGEFSDWNDQDQNEGIQEAAADSHHPETREAAQRQPNLVQSAEDIDIKEEIQAVVQHPLDNTKSKPTEQGGSDWIGSGLTGLLSFAAKSDSDSEDKKTEDQDSFRSRKLALDIDGNQLEKEVKTETASWLGERLTGILGFGQKKKTLDEVLKVDIVKEEEESLRPETHYHSREDAQYPRADYGTDRPEYLHASISNGEKDRDAREGDIAAGINRLSEDEELHTTGQSSAGFHQSPVSTYKTGVTDVIALCVTFAGQVAVQCKDRIQSSFSLLE
ncbi:hypothetical protein Z043_120745, partial [Scleropages formosus]